MEMRAQMRTFCAASLLVLFGCAVPAPSTSDRSFDAPSAAPVRKTITTAALNQIKFGDWSESGGGGGLSLSEIHSSALVTNDIHGGFEPRLAARLPSLADGSITLLPDGRMQVTWTLRPNVKWQDGTPLTADDLVFTWQAYARRDIPLSISSEIAGLDAVEALDPRTARFTYRAVYFKPTYMGLREFWPLPRHLLAEALDGDPQAFVNLPYWTTSYVHLGAFRLVDYAPGENLAFERFDDYFLGRPRVDSVVIRTIADPNAMFASLKAGAVDIATESTLDGNLVMQLRDDWRSTGGGNVYQRFGTLRTVLVQMNPEWAQPPEIASDVRIRRGLYRGIDRAALAEVVLPGFPEVVTDSLLKPTDPRAAAVGRPFAQYRYDPVEAAQELASAGWRRDASGRLVNPSGEQVRLGLRTGAGDALEMATIASFWRQLGADVAEEIIPLALARDAEYRARFPAFDVSGRPGTDTLPSYFDSRARPTAANRYVGLNAGSYVSAPFDRLTDRLNRAIDDREQAAVLKEIGEVLAADLPVMLTYGALSLIAVVKGVRAGEDYPGAASPGYMSRNAHLWDRE